MSQQVPMIIAEEFKEILTTLEKYGKVEYKSLATTYYIPPQATMSLLLQVETLEPGKVWIIFEHGFTSTVTCLEMQLIVDGNMYGYEPCYQPRLYDWGLSYFHHGILMVVKNYLWFTCRNPTDTPAFLRVRYGYTSIDKELFEKMEQKFFSIIRQAIQA